MGGDCKRVTILVKVANPSAPAYTYCSGGDCLWSGDANNDGVANIDDYIPIARNIGASGLGRAGANTSWYGQNYHQWDNYGLQYVDTDGDGIVTAADTLAVSANYNATHSIVSGLRGFPSDLPFTFVPDKQTVKPGDTLNVALVLGTVDNPALNVSGFSFRFSAENYKVQGKNNISLDLEQNNWLAPYSAYVVGSKKIGHGTVDAAFMLSNQRAASGRGQVGKVSIVVTEDISGFSKNSGNTFRMHLTNVHTILPSGEVLVLRDVDLAIPIVKQSVNVVTPATVSVYPNPSTQGDVNISLNSSTGVITGARLMDMAGRVLREVTGLSAGELAMHTGDLRSGLYLVEVTTDLARSVHKLEVIK